MNRGKGKEKSGSQANPVVQRELREPTKQLRGKEGERPTIIAFPRVERLVTLSWTERSGLMTCQRLSALFSTERAQQRHDHPGRRYSSMNSPPSWVFLEISALRARFAAQLPPRWRDPRRVQRFPCLCPSTLRETDQTLSRRRCSSLFLCFFPRSSRGSRVTRTTRAGCSFNGSMP